MTLAELRTLALQLVDDPNGTKFDSTRANAAVNLGKDWVLDELEDTDGLFSQSSQAYTFTANWTTGEQSLPSDFRNAVRLSTTTDNQKVEIIDVRQIEQSPYYLGWPFSAYIRGDKIGVINGSGSDTLTLYYTQNIADLSVDGSSFTNIPTHFHKAIAIAAAYILLASEGKEVKGIGDMYKYEIDRLKRKATERDRSGAKYVQYVGR